MAEMKAGTKEKFRIKNATFITSAATESQFIRPDKPMIAVCGKSNVGKSSFINMLAGQKKLARTSADPGRTRLVNYFDFGEFILADLPGYGFAKVSKAEKEKWGKTLDAFFRQKQDIAHVFMLADSRHDPTADDVQMIKFLNFHIIPFTIVLTKSDKLSKMQLKTNIRAIAADVCMGESNLLPTSSQTGLGKDEVLEKISWVLSKAQNIDEESDDQDSDDQESDDQESKACGCESGDREEEDKTQNGERAGDGKEE